jgi:hypothetical protein
MKTKPIIQIKCKRIKCGKIVLTNNPDRKYCSKECYKLHDKEQGIRIYKKNNIRLTKWENGNITIVRDFPGGSTYQFRHGDLENIFTLLNEYLPIEVLRKMDERRESIEKEII